MRLYSEPIRFPESARDEADLYPLYLRYRYHPDTIRHGCCQWYVNYRVTFLQPADDCLQISLSKKTFVIVVCYRPDPTQNVDEKLKFVEACSFKRRSFPAKVESFPSSPGSSSPPRSQACERSRFCIPRHLRRTAFSERPRCHVLRQTPPPFDPSGARGEMFGVSEQF